MANHDKGKTVAAGALAAVAGGAALDVTQEDILAELSSPTAVTAEQDENPAQTETLSLLEQDPKKVQELATDLALALQRPELMEQITDAMQSVATDIQPRYSRLAELNDEFDKLLPDRADDDVLLSPEDAKRIRELNTESEKLYRELGVLDDRLRTDLETLIKNELGLPESTDLLLAVRYPYNLSEQTRTLPFRTTVYVEDLTKLDADAAAEYLFQQAGKEVAMVQSRAQNINLQEILMNPLVPNAVLRGIEEIRDQRGFQQIMRWQPWDISADGAEMSATYDLSPIKDRILSATGIKLEEAFSVDITGAEFGEPELEIRFGSKLYTDSGVRMSGSGQRSMSLSFKISPQSEVPVEVGNPVLETRK